MKDKSEVTTKTILNNNLVIRRSNAILLICSFLLTAQTCVPPVKEMEFVKTRSFQIQEDNKTIRFSLFHGPNPTKPKSDRTYYWYSQGAIHKTRGDYAGRLLDGMYSVFESSGALIQRGRFVMGTREGRWVKWYPDGSIEDLEEYTDGNKHGVFATYSPHGTILLLRTFRRDVLNGKSTQFDSTGRKIQILRYRDGHVRDTIYDVNNEKRKTQKVKTIKDDTSKVHGE